MKLLIEAVILKILRIVLRIFHFFSVRKNRIMFMSYTGKAYSCNPKYIYKYLKATAPEMEFVWVFAEKPFESDDLKDALQIKLNSIRFFKMALTCQVFISNGGGFTYLPFRNTQITINTWHGGGAYKRVAMDATPHLGQKSAHKYISKHTTWFVSGCKKFSEIMQPAMLLDDGKMLEVGMPRNDMFFGDTLELRQKVREYLQIEAAEKIILYAPTYRGHFHNIAASEDNIEIENCLAALEQRFSAPFRFVYRAHYSRISNKVYKNAINASQYPDMQELLCAADVLITDYSSSIWDYSFTGKPCFLFAPDVAQYKDSDRGFYTPISQWPFPLAQSNKKLTEVIANFDSSQYAKAIEIHHKDLGSFETGQASEKITEIILTACNK